MLNKKSYLPDKIYLISPDGKSSKSFVLSAIQRNVTVDNVIFKGKILPKPWEVRRDVLGADEKKLAPAAAARPAGAPAKKATRRQ